MVLSFDRWVGKAAIVTGASSGIGAAICAALVDNGLLVVGLARRSELVEQLSESLAGKKGILYPFKADITKEEDILAAFKWATDNVGPVHVLVNSAGLLKEELLTEGKTEDWRREFDINVLGPCIANREAVKIMKANDIKGHIINLNSIAGHFVPPVQKMNVYSATKHAVTALTETLRQELNHLQSKIRVTSISPGLTHSEMTVLNKEFSEERINFLKSRPILKGEDIADAVIYVLSTPEHVQIHQLTIKPVGEPL